MKKFSIIIPVYNEPKFIIKCLKSISETEYRNDLVEIIIINDCSTDNTKSEIEKFIRAKKNFKLINNKNNLGRARTRLIGARGAKSNNLIFLDSRVTIGKKALNYLSTKNEKVIIAGDLGYGKPKTVYDIFFQIIKGKIYAPSFPQKEPKIKIEKSNFDHVPKGTTACFFDKKIFLKAARSFGKDKNVSDDIKLFENSLKIVKSISRDNKFKMRYYNRNNLIEIVKHTFNRGPKFVDYYFRPKKRFFWSILTVYISTIANLFFLLKPRLFLYEIIVILLILIIGSIHLSQNIKQFLICLYLLPIIGISFLLGLLKGGLLKISRLTG